MSLIEEVSRKFRLGQFEFAEHTADQTIHRHIQVEELLQAVTSAEVVEDYPGDKYGSSCLILGYTEEGRPLHIHCSYPSRELIRVITVYEPDPSIWIDFRSRKIRNDM